MKRGKFIFKKFGVLLLVGCMLLSTLGMTFAPEGESASLKTIETFDALDKAVAEQSVPLGTAQKDLKLPDKLKSTVDGAAADAPVKEWKAKKDTPAYDPDKAGDYVFVPAFDPTHILDEGVKLPEITVTVEAAPVTLTPAGTATPTSGASTSPTPTNTPSPTEGPEVAFTFDPDEPIYLPKGVPVTDADLLMGVSAVDENGDALTVTVKDAGELNMQNPQRPDGPVFPPKAYTITYEAKHPDTDEMFTAAREAYVTAGLAGIAPIAVGLPSFDHTYSRFYANGTPIIIKENGGITSAYDSTGNTLLSDTYDLKNYIIYGGWESGDETGDTSITIESGTFDKTIYGGSREGTITGSTSIVIEDGTFTYVYGGSAIGAVTGNTSVLIKDGTILWELYGGGNQATATVGGNTNIKIEKGTFLLIFGGGFRGNVTGDTNVTIDGGVFWSELVSSIGTVHGGGLYGSARDTYITVNAIDDVMVNNGGQANTLAVFGSGQSGSARDTNVMINGGNMRNIFGGGVFKESITANTNVTVGGNAKARTVFGGGDAGSVTGDVKVVIEDQALIRDNVLGGCANMNSQSGDPPASVGGKVSIELKDTAVVDQGIFGGGQGGSVGSAEIDLKGGTVNRNGLSSKPVCGGGMHDSDSLGGDVTGSAIINVYPEVAISGGNTNISFDGWGASATVGSGSKINYYYKATYDANTGSGTPPAAGYILSYSKLYNGSTQQGTDTALGAGGLSKAGHTFSGWNTQAGGGGTPYTMGAVLNPTQNITLYAQWAAADYTINGTGYAWTDSAIITLSANNDELIILADSSPASAVRINVTAPDNSTATITGRGSITYDNLYITVTNKNITLNIEDLSIIAPTTAATTGTAAVLFPSGSATINVTGDCELQGGALSSPTGTAGAGLSGGYNYPEIMIAGNGTLTVRGANGYYGGGGILNVRNLTVNAKLTVYAGATSANTGGIAGITALNNLTVNKELYVVGGSTAATTSNAMGASGLSVTGTLVMNAKITAIGGDGPIGGTGFLWGGTTGGNLEINAPMVATGGKGTLTTGGVGLNPSRNRLVVNSDLSATGGDGITTGGYGIYAAYNVGTLRSDVVINDGNVIVKGGAANSGGHSLCVNNTDLTVEDGNLKVYGGEGIAAGGTGINALGTGNVYINGGIVEATGGKSTAVNSNGYGRGIYAANEFVIEGGRVTATSGETNSLDFLGADAIYGKLIIIKGGTVLASGTQQIPAGATNFSGGCAISAGMGGLSITGGTVTVIAGGAKGTYSSFPYGIYSAADITISDAKVTASSNGPAAAIYILGKFIIKNGANVTATGGNSESNAGGDGIYTQSDVDISDSIVNAYGGNGTANNANGGRGIVTEKSGSYISITGGIVTALGGDGVQHGGHGIFAYFGPIDIKNGANVTSIGGNTTGAAAGNMGGVGIRAFGVEVNSGINYGETVTITNNAGNVYIRGGMGSSANGQRPSIMAQDVYIATGNVGAIVKEGNAPVLTVENIAGGEDVYMLTANTSPAAAVPITANASTLATGLSPSYIYKAPTQNDGVAYMWLPTGNQTASASGYNDGSANVTVNNLAAVTLTATKRITSVTVSPKTANVSKGGSQQFTADVVVENGAPQTVNWSVDSAISSIDASGKLTVAANETKTTLTITATSTYDATKKDTAAVTVTEAPPTYTDANISSTAAVFDKNSASTDYQNISVTLNPGSYTLSSIKTGNTTLQAGTHYTVSGSAYTFKKEYLTTLNLGTQAITFDMSGGADPTLTVTIRDTTKTEYNVITAFEKFTGSGNRTAKIDADYSKFVRLLFGGAAVDPANYDAASGSTVIILKESYLKTFANGTYHFTAEFTDGYADLTLVVDVQDNINVAVTGVKLNKSSAALGVGKTLQLTATVSPDNATDKGVMWSSDDTSVATVDASGKITAKKIGTTTITVTTDDGGYTATCKVTVTETGRPQTGETGNMMGWIIALLSSMLGILCVLVWRKWRQLKGVW